VLSNLVKLYGKIKYIHFKRKNIQRYNIFSKPVYGYSLSRIANANDMLHRKDTYTDSTKYIDEISIIDLHTIKKLHAVGYYKLSDIALTNKEILSNETNLPENAISELYTLATSNYHVPYLDDGNIVESKQKSEVIGSLIKSNWRIFILLEYSLLKYIKNQIEKIYHNFNSKFDLILEFKNKLCNPKEFIEAISFCTNSSQKYVRDVLSGRIENNLSQKEKEEILDRDNNKCRICDSKNNLEIHHIIPVANGGGKYNKNLCTLCSECHFTIAHGKNTSTISYDSQNEFWDDIIGEKP